MHCSQINLYWCVQLYLYIGSNEGNKVFKPLSLKDYYRNPKFNNAEKHLVYFIYFFILKALFVKLRQSGHFETLEARVQKDIEGRVVEVNDK